MASIKLKGDTSGEVTIQAPSVAGTTTLNLPATSSTLATTAQASIGMKNRIINGNMAIDQRNSGASSTLTNSVSYTLDRYRAVALGTSLGFSSVRSTTAPADFSQSYLATVTSAKSVAATDQTRIDHFIEGYNVADLNFGTANAKTITLSFWVRSSITGTYCVHIGNSTSPSRSFLAEYTISSANTFEYKTITISGDTTGTWTTVNGVGLGVSFVLGMGSNFTGSAGWQAGEKFQTSNQTQWIGTSGATFYITGVQLEANTTATPFENLQYGQQLALCQRYFERMAEAVNVPYSSGSATYANQPRTVLFYKTQKRAVPTLSSSAASEFRFQFSSSVNTPSAISLASIGVDTAFLNATGITISADTPCILISNSSSSYLDFSSEL